LEAKPLFYLWILMEKELPKSAFFLYPAFDFSSFTKVFPEEGNPPTFILSLLHFRSLIFSDYAHRFVWPTISVDPKNISPSSPASISLRP
jgi:hypothetical protein